MLERIIFYEVISEPVNLYTDRSAVVWCFWIGKHQPKLAIVAFGYGFPKTPIGFYQITWLH